MTPQVVLAAVAGFVAGFVSCTLAVLLAVAEALEGLQRCSRPDKGAP